MRRRQHRVPVTGDMDQWNIEAVKPSDRLQRDLPAAAEKDDPLEAVAGLWESSRPSAAADSVFGDQVPVVDS